MSNMSRWVNNLSWGRNSTVIRLHVWTNQQNMAKYEHPYLHVNHIYCFGVDSIAVNYVTFITFIKGKFHETSSHTMSQLRQLCKLEHLQRNRHTEMIWSSLSYPISIYTYMIKKWNIHINWRYWSRLYAAYDCESLCPQKAQNFSRVVTGRDWWNVRFLQKQNISRQWSIF